MSRPTTPPAGLASGAQCLPAGALSTRQQTAPHAPPPPPRPKGQGISGPWFFQKSGWVHLSTPPPPPVAMANKLR